MTGSSPMSIQAKGEPAPIVPAAIQIPKAMITTEIESENASFMMTSRDVCLSDECQPLSKIRRQPGPAIQPYQPARKGKEGRNVAACPSFSEFGSVLRTASGGE